MRGEVVWYDASKGYGFLVIEDGRRVFVHSSQLAAADALRSGERVEVELAEGPKGLRAREVRRVCIALDDDCAVADALARCALSKPRWSQRELEERGVGDVPRAIRRHRVIARLGQHGSIPVLKGGDLIFERLPALDAPLTPPEIEDIDARDESWTEALIAQGEQHVLLVGPPGCGKTELMRRVLGRVSPRGYVSTSLHGEIGVDDLFGTRELRAGNTQTVDGPLTRAMKQDVPLLVNELDAACPEVMFALFDVLDRRAITLPFAGEDGQPVHLDPWSQRAPGELGFMVAATANTTGHGEGAAIYYGTRPLNAALIDRFAVIRLGYPSAQAEAAMLRRTARISELVASRIALLAELVREAFDQGHLTTPFSLRTSRAWASLIAKLGASSEQAFRWTVLDRVADSNERALLVELYQRCFGVTP